MSTLGQKHQLHYQLVLKIYNRPFHANISALLMSTLGLLALVSIGTEFTIAYFTQTFEQC